MSASVEVKLGDESIAVTVPPERVVIGYPGPQGPPGPPGSAGNISTDPGNDLTTGTDGGLFVEVGSGGGTGDYLPLSGGTLTGNLTVEGDVTSAYISSGYGADMGGFVVTSVADPVEPTDAANKQYVDANAGGGGSGTPGIVDGALTIKGAPLTAFDQADAAALRIHMHDGAGVYPAWPQFHIYLQDGKVIAGWGTGASNAQWQITIPTSLSAGSPPGTDLVVGFPILTQSRLTFQVLNTWEKFEAKATPVGVTINDQLIVLEGALAERDARIGELEAKVAQLLGDYERIFGSEGGES